MNTLRRRGRHTEQLDEQFDGVPQPPDVLEEKLRVERLVQSIGELPERQRTAIVAHELEGRSYEEIADRMGATTPVVRQLVHRARTRLRDACGVLVPVWALRWLSLADLRAAGPDRVGDAVAGGAAGAGILKAGTALLATGAIATGAGGLVTQEPGRGGGDRQKGAQAHTAAAPAAGDPRGEPRVALSSPPLATVVSKRPEAAGGDRQGGPEPEAGSRDRGDDHDDGSRHERPRGDRDDRNDHEGGGDSEPEEPHKASHEEPADEPDEGSQESDSSGQGPSGAPDDSEGSDPPEDSTGAGSPPEAPPEQ